MYRGWKQHRKPSTSFTSWINLNLIFFSFLITFYFSLHFDTNIFTFYSLHFQNSLVTSGLTHLRGINWLYYTSGGNNNAYKTVLLVFPSPVLIAHSEFIALYSGVKWAGASGMVILVHMSISCGCGTSLSRSGWRRGESTKSNIFFKWQVILNATF